MLKNTIKNVSIKRKTEKNQRQLICFESDMARCRIMLRRLTLLGLKVVLVALNTQRFCSPPFWKISRGKRLVLILGRQRIKKYTDTSVHTYPVTQRVQKFPLWRAYKEISGYTERIRRTRVDARCIRIKKIFGYKNLRIRVDGALSNRSYSR